MSGHDDTDGADRGHQADGGSPDGQYPGVPDGSPARYRGDAAFC